MNRIIIFLLLILHVGCSSSKSIVKSKKITKKVSKIEPRKITVNTLPVKISTGVANSENVSVSKMETLEATSKVKVTNLMIDAYINQYKDIAKANMTKFGVPASIILGQGILESGAGTGDLSIQANNHFGIKCHKEWLGPSVRHDDDALGECFRKYAQGSESYYDHSLFLTSRSWYASLFKLSKNDYKSWAKGLKKAGYATDPKYPEKLIRLIEKYQLQQYDAEVLGIESGISPKVKEAVKEVLKEEIIVISNPDDYIVAKGDTLYSVSKKFNITIDDLKKKNNITEETLSLGQSLKVK
jgi:flagellum-specific peptidoglycan hydrolase FlgJ